MPKNKTRFYVANAKKPLHARLLSFPVPATISYYVFIFSPFLAKKMQEQPFLELHNNSKRYYSPDQDHTVEHMVHFFHYSMKAFDGSYICCCEIHLCKKFSSYKFRIALVCACFYATLQRSAKRLLLYCEDCLGQRLLIRMLEGLVLLAFKLRTIKRF